MLRICHISDTHGAKYHEKLIIPECDVLIHSGDIGGRTNLVELSSFLNWFNQQPGNIHILIGGNHDICMDSQRYVKIKSQGRDLVEMLCGIACDGAEKLLAEYPGVIYLNNSGFTYEGVSFWGSPYTPSFHKSYWAFNADRGTEIKAIWKKIPIDTQVLITHGPPYGIMDIIPDSFKESENEDVHRGCVDLMEIIREMPNLKLHCFGHIHDGPTAIQAHRIGDRDILFSNAAVLSNNYTQVLFNPTIINLP